MVNRAAMIWTWIGDGQISVAFNREWKQGSHWGETADSGVAMQMPGALLLRLGWLVGWVEVPEMICIEPILGCKTIETAVGVDPALKPHYGNGGSMTNVFTPTLVTLHRPTCAQCGCSYSAMYTT